MKKDHTEEPSLCMKEIGCEPKVLGWRLLIKGPDAPKKIGNIIVADQYREAQARRQNMGLVLKIGPSAFNDRFEDRRVEVGDWVHYSILEREAVYPNDYDCYYINDDKIIAILDHHEVPMFYNSKK